ncbi:MAG: hypothetical protein J7L82_03645 [Staphylothermus sp.]|nr:hypothetical protein [Staphylothermus sp.]
MHPYKFTLRVQAGFSKTHAKLLLDIEALRLRYIEPLKDPVKSLRASLKEVRDFLINISAPFSLLEIMGLGSPIPHTIQLKGAGLGDESVKVESEGVSLADLADVKIFVYGATTTQPLSPTETTITITEHETETKTVTTTHTETIIERIIETTTKTEKTTETHTETYTDTTILHLYLYTTGNHDPQHWSWYSSCCSSNNYSIDGFNA